ncbi:hypothetical protein CsSME_00000022 [Camellia sinensis var. sinensis]
MGVSSMKSINSDKSSATSSHTHKMFLFCNYILLGAASSCIFLTLSLRLIPSLCGFFLILLQILTIAGAISGCTAASSSSSSSSAKWYGAHMVATVLTAIFQGSVSVMIFTRTSDFLGNLKSYVREEDGEVILRMVGGLCVAIFCFEWVVLTLAFFLNYNAIFYYGAHHSSSATAIKTTAQEDDDLKNWPWPFQV